MEIRIERQFINEDLAKQAKEAISWFDYDPASSMGATVRYEKYCKSFEQHVSELINRYGKPDDETMNKIQYYADRYGVKMANAINDDNACTASCPSIMIAGGSNFPVRRKERQNARAESLWERDKDLYDVKNNYYMKKIRNLLDNHVIYSDDKDAIEKLQTKIEALKHRQEYMVKCNKYFRVNKTMKGCEGISDADVERIDNSIKDSPAYLGGAMFPKYALSNNNQNIHRLEKRLQSLLEAKKAAESVATDNAEQVINDSVKVVRDSEIMRLQIIFDDIPSADVRDVLKHNGFRWSPKNHAWQRLLNNTSEYALARVLPAIQ